MLSLTSNHRRRLAAAIAGVALAPLASLLTAAPVVAEPQHGQSPAAHATTVPQVFGHRGAPGYRPEHTLASYKLAIDLGADYIEPDLVSTKDHVLVARHENNITATTDVADHPEFADRKTTKVIDGQPQTGWFTEDFTLAELKTLRAKERLPQVRPQNTAYDGRFEVPTFDEILALVKREEHRTGRTIGVAPETKHPTYFDSIGLSPEEPMLRSLRHYGMDNPHSKVVIQSFEVGNLQQLNRMTPLPLEQLVDSVGGPADKPGTTYSQMLTPSGMRAMASYADWVGPNKDLVLPRNPATGATGAPSSLVPDAHRAGLKVVIWTIRNENQFMATNFRRGTDPNAAGDVHSELLAFLNAGVDGLFADYPDAAVAARADWLHQHD